MSKKEEFGQAGLASGVGEVVQAVYMFPFEFGMDFPEAAREYLAKGKEAKNPLGIVFGAAAWGMRGMNMDQKAVTEVLAKAMGDITAPEEPVPPTPQK